MTLPDPSQVDAWRRAIGEGCRVWARERVVITEAGWEAFSGAPLADYNLVGIHSADGGEALGRGLDHLGELGVPGMVMLGGPGLAVAGDLIDRSWIPVAATPMMAMHPEDYRRVEPPPDDGIVCGLARPQDRDEAMAIVVDAFDLPPELGLFALPDAPGPGGYDLMALWADGTMVTTAGAVLTDDGVSVSWSMATPKTLQRRGYGKRLMHHIVSSAIDAGATSLVHLASPPGIKAYLELGFRTAEHWQVWSRPRWVLGR